jgi:hypothetical protein
MLYAILVPSVLYLLWLGFEHLRGALRPPPPRKHRPF